MGTALELTENRVASSGEDVHSIEKESVEKAGDWKSG
jgi:hypothetical protein